jgi:hypothetical protein
MTRCRIILVERGRSRTAMRPQRLQPELQSRSRSRIKMMRLCNTGSNASSSDPSVHTLTKMSQTVK